MGITSRPQAAISWSALARERHPVDVVMFDTTLQTVIIERSHFRGSGYAPVFLRYIYEASNESDHIAKIFLILVSTSTVDSIFKIHAHAI